MGHTIVSAAIGTGVWIATGKPLAVPAATAAGVLIDSDHLLDYFQWYVRKNTRRAVVLFHAWEYAAAALMAAAVWYHPLLLAAALGYLGHVVGDHVANERAHPLAYSIIYRVRWRFDRIRIFGEPKGTFSDALHKRIPLWGRVEPLALWFVARFPGRSR